ncbi:BA14K family protein [Methylobacterium fujisawaense]|uniref:BA14K family protein n=1 Tax=Methylobacterium fujisawaense TaxID=107400 RepID=UPI00313BA36F
MKLSFSLAAAVAASLLGQPAFARPAPAPVEALSAGTLPTSYVQYRRFGHRGFRRGYGYRRGYGRGYGYRRGRSVGAAVGAGVAGLAAGAIIGGAIANSQAHAAQGAVGSEAVAACARRFRSYDASSGTYLGNDGDRHACP